MCALPQLPQRFNGNFCAQGASCLTVVRAGCTISHIGVSSKPAMETSPGTEIHAPSKMHQVYGVIIRYRKDGRDLPQPVQLCPVKFPARLLLHGNHQQLGLSGGKPAQNP